MAVNLNSLDQMPTDIRKSLQKYRHLFIKARSIEGLLEDVDIFGVAEHLDHICRKEGVICYHFTRAVQHEIRVRGLEVSSGADRRSQFISSHGNLFSEGQRRRIRQAWGEYFDEEAPTARDGKIWFNLTLNALNNGGADRLLRFFGGEQIYMPLTQDDEIAAVLQTVGEPLIVECALPTEILYTFSEIPWGKTWLSTYHLSIRQEALQFDQDASTRKPVPTSQIVTIRAAEAQCHSVWRIKPCL